jgi:hypothetical protein
MGVGNALMYMNRSKTKMAGKSIFRHVMVEEINNGDLNKKTGCGTSPHFF